MLTHFYLRVLKGSSDL